MPRAVQQAQPHMNNIGGGAQMEYRYQRMSPCTCIAIPAHYTDEDVERWKKKLVERLDRTFEEIWEQLSDEEKIRINEACAEE